MFQKFRHYWALGAILVLGGLLPITLGAQESRVSTPVEQGAKASPCPFCGQPWGGRADLEMTIPEKLPAPRNQLWVSKLRRVLGMEKLARAQYEADQKKFGITNPYRDILPQINLHLAWINKLFAAYGLPAEEKTYPPKTPDSVLQALKNGRQLETDLAAQYEWLLNHTEDKTTKRVLNTLLTQTKLNIIMFQNDIRIIEIEGSMAPLLL